MPLPEFVHRALMIGPAVRRHFHLPAQVCLSVPGGWMILSREHGYGMTRYQTFVIWDRGAVTMTNGRTHGPANDG